MKLIVQEIASVQTLYRKGLARKPRLLALQRRRVEIISQRREATARLESTFDIIRRSEIRAPLRGVVVGLKAHTIGGVIKPGAPIMSIVPDDEKLVIEARIDPNDIDVVRTGLKAYVRITPYSARLLAPVPGHVRSISADRLTDERSGQFFYLARIELERSPDPKAAMPTLYPGMPVEVMIVTGERRLLDYIINPFLKSLGRAFREG